MATLNFTGRLDIDRSKVQIRTREDDGKVLLDVLALDLSDMGLPSTAEVAVEAYRQTVKVRIPCGTVGAVEKPENVLLSAFDVSDNVQLRVRVVGSEGASHGMILAVVDRLRGVTEEDQESEPLLKLQRADLGDLVWKFGIDGDRPILYVNKYLQDHDGIVNAPFFKSLILPEFFRQVCLWIARNLDDSQDPHSTISHWLVYLDSIDVDLKDLDDLEPDDPGNTEVIENWAENAASRFAAQINSLAMLEGVIPTEGDGNDG